MFYQSCPQDSKLNYNTVLQTLHSNFTNFKAELVKPLASFLLVMFLCLNLTVTLQSYLFVDFTCKFVLFTFHFPVRSPGNKVVFAE